MTTFCKFTVLALTGILVHLTFCTSTIEAFYGFSRMSLYEDVNQEGDYFFTRVGRECIMLPEGIQEKASSVDTHETCLHLCRLPNCRSCVRMYPGGPGHQDLRDVDLNDQVVSAKACDRTR